MFSPDGLSFGPALRRIARMILQERLDRNERLLNQSFADLFDSSSIWNIANEKEFQLPEFLLTLCPLSENTDRGWLRNTALILENCFLSSASSILRFVRHKI
jgi:hypothetical protein